MQYEWGWCLYGEAEAKGPFDSYVAAMSDAANFVSKRWRSDQLIKVAIGTCLYVEPEAWADDDIDHFLERMDQDACGDEFSFWDDEIFSIAPEKREEAQKELSAALRGWAAKYVTAARVWRLADDWEMVELYGGLKPEVDPASSVR